MSRIFSQKFKPIWIKVYEKESSEISLVMLNLMAATQIYQSSCWIIICLFRMLLSFSVVNLLCLILFCTDLFESIKELRANLIKWSESSNIIWISVKCQSRTCSELETSNKIKRNSNEYVQKEDVHRIFTA